MKIFCKKCGFCNNYNITPPNECIKCEFSFNSNIFINTAKNNNYEVTSVPAENKKERNDFKNIKPAFKVTVYQAKSHSLSSLIDPNKEKEPQQILAPEQKAYNTTSIQKSQDQILEEFKKEGSSLR